MIQDRVRNLLREMNRIYVSAYQMNRESYFGDLALIYSERKIELEEDSDSKRIGKRSALPRAVRKRPVLSSNIIRS
jgi:hypothetical protein